MSSAVAAPAARRDTSAATRQHETDIIVIIIIPLPAPRWRGRRRDDDPGAWKTAEGEVATCGGGRIGVEKRRTRAARREDRGGSCLISAATRTRHPKKGNAGICGGVLWLRWAVRMPHGNFASRDADAKGAPRSGGPRGLGRLGDILARSGAHNRTIFWHWHGTHAGRQLGIGTLEAFVQEFC